MENEITPIKPKNQKREEEIKVQSLEEIRKSIEKTPKKYHIYLRTQFYGALRPMEPAIIKKSYLRPKTNEIKIPGKYTKGKKNRLIQVPSFLMKELLELSKVLDENDYIFSGYEYRKLYYHYTKASESIGARATPHWLRHSFITHKGIELLRSGKFEKFDILEILQDYAGHSERKNTEIYLHWADELNKKRIRIVSEDEVV